MKEYLTKLAKLDGDLQLYLRQGQDGVDAKLVQKQLSAQDGWKDAFEMQVFENNQLLIEQRREQATLLGAEATSLLALASEIHGLSQVSIHPFIQPSTTSSLSLNLNLNLSVCLYLS